MVLDEGTELLELGTIMGHDEPLPGAGAGVVTGCLYHCAHYIL